MYTRAQHTSTIADLGARTTVPFGTMPKTIASRLSPKTRTFRNEAFSTAIRQSSSGFGQPTVLVLKSRVSCGRLSPSSSGLFKRTRNRAWCLGSAPKRSRKHLPSKQPAAWYYRARYYDPQSGRFLTEDSLGFKGNGPDFYKYTLNDPTDLTDPLGLNAQPVPLPWRGPVLVPDPGRGIPFPWLPIVGRTVGFIIGTLLNPDPTSSTSDFGPGNYHNDLLNHHSNQAMKKCKDNKDNGCQPCLPPVGTISFRLDTTGPAHRGVPTPHYHLFVMQQSPAPMCQCQWVEIPDNQGGFGGGNPPAGTVPRTDPPGGGGLP